MMVRVYDLMSAEGGPGHGSKQSGWETSNSGMG